MSDSPLVSIIIPTYKSNESLQVAIDSVLNQTYQNIEIIVVDDNNPDTLYRDTAEQIMLNYNNNTRLIYIKHEKNKNGATARNTGFKASKGDYIGFLDDDDIFIKTKIEKQVKYLNSNNKFHAVYTWRHQHGEIISYDKTGDLSEELLSLSFTPYTSSIMLKRECYDYLKGFDEKYKRHQDFEFLLRFFEKYKIGVINEPLVEIRGNQVNNTLKGRELERLKEQFLSQFMYHINRINYARKGFKSLVLGRHYSTVFWSYCRQFKLLSAVRVFSKYSILSGPAFWLSILNYLKKYLSRRIKLENK
ncbi:glycosyltransferase family 2 protein [Sutcliffiella sp. NC1]|uniref:glycosyltransferase family 2 protein n=1 Tax=Sutcliffiella sp. NC1 TaxID=3004096 RepID=UPI0022DD57E0|nr:glycosyltransferase family 2 protein [Sutcliffiella sp. NC1]WBL14825.1 glycosyltransferase family 2 protein [Sutcliffiella sp. NC1]